MCGSNSNLSFFSRGDIPSKSVSSPDFPAMVKRIIDAILRNCSHSFGRAVEMETLMSGKMLRTRFAARLIENECAVSNYERIAIACAATELAHTASLCHDDVIDNGLIRRGVPSLWKRTTPSCSVLIGDMFFCESIELLLQAYETRLVSRFISKIKEVCATEVEQEIIYRGEKIDESTCMSIARGKTGPLFGFIGYVLGDGDEHLSIALEEAGYRIGAAYQLYDDILDIVGSESLSGKTLRGDAKRGKTTLPQLTENSLGITKSKISEMCSAALESVNRWPLARKGVESFLVEDLRPVFERIQPGTVRFS